MIVFMFFPFPGLSSLKGVRHPGGHVCLQGQPSTLEVATQGPRQCCAVCSARGKKEGVGGLRRHGLRAPFGSV